MNRDDLAAALAQAIFETTHPPSFPTWEEYLAAFSHPPTQAGVWTRKAERLLERLETLGLTVAALPPTGSPETVDSVLAAQGWERISPGSPETLREALVNLSYAVDAENIDGYTAEVQDAYRVAMEARAALEGSPE